jgi:hypothetical protein
MDSKLGLLLVCGALTISLFLAIRFIGKPNLVSMIGYVAKAKPGLGKSMNRVFFLR